MKGARDESADFPGAESGPVWRPGALAAAIRTATVLPDRILLTLPEDGIYMISPQGYPTRSRVGAGMSNSQCNTEASRPLPWTPWAPWKATPGHSLRGGPDWPGLGLPQRLALPPASAGRAHIADF